MREKGHWSLWAEHRSHHLGEGAPWYWFGWAGSRPYGCGRGGAQELAQELAQAGRIWALLSMLRGGNLTQDTPPLCVSRQMTCSVSHSTRPSSWMPEAAMSPQENGKEGLQP